MMKTENGKEKQGENVERLSFFDRVYAVVRRIPKGRVVSYGQIARALGRSEERR